MGGTGDVHFPITTPSTEARQFFDQAVGQLHGFWYYEAERSFRRVRALDPDCAMAGWGMAMANIENGERAREFIAEAIAKKSAASERERLYIDALAEYLKEGGEKKERRQSYIKALEKIVRRFPDDIEAKALLVELIWRSKDDLPIVSHAAVDALLDDVLAANPMHPAHHYRIHLWDQEDPSQALPSAARCGQAAPSIAHMWHMPGHIYSRLHRYADAAWQQEASARADHSYMIRDCVLPDQIHNYAHNNEWLIRNLVHLGRWRDALSLAKNMLELPRHPKFNSFERKEMDSCKYGRRRLMEVLETFELWDQVIALADTMYLEPTNDATEQAKRLRLMGLAHHHLGQWAEFERCREQLDQVADVDGEESEQEDNKPNETAQHAAKELEGLACLARGDTDGAVQAFDDCGELSSMRKARYAFRCGDHQRAEAIIKEAVKKGRNEVPPLAVQVDLLRRMGRADDADRAFQSLRQITGHADLDAPLFQPLEKLADKFRLPKDWRLSPESADDVGERPDLDSLGPFRWVPAAAPTWSLFDSQGQHAGSDDYIGRPVVVIFYLGHGCLHCVEQLQKIAPRKADFAAAGIDLVAISSEGPLDLAKSADNFASKSLFEVLLAADPELGVFQAYRAYDAFEQTPLHATFLVDAAGLVRWHDIGHEPFGDIDFLLTESRRLLAFPVTR
jgi:peroxiredoxin